MAHSNTGLGGVNALGEQRLFRTPLGHFDSVLFQLLVKGMTEIAPETHPFATIAPLNTEKRQAGYAQSDV
ncbi:hypothetical protein CAI21_11630 [Alkalilimnicola ehrlichii]|uniref:Uncharacterized protein n=1 Tax=Alkalilimnicola ehrlichii TaxID=351052 RepID=A0A3E0WU55_9GAMM|nr:hypothetical protein CAI21_11630 [Alkalilimnicola ehrlichii]RFA35681.1 hypothetical protein CAL65_12150 [Alkalilimnicola ehrlichii]